MNTPQQQPRRRAQIEPVNADIPAQIDAKVIEQIPEKLALRLRLVPLRMRDDGYLEVAMEDPMNYEQLDTVRFATSNMQIMGVKADKEQIEDLLRLYYPGDEFSVDLDVPGAGGTEKFSVV